MTDPRTFQRNADPVGRILELVQREVSPPESEWRNWSDDDALRSALEDELRLMVREEVRAVLATATLGLPSEPAP